MTLTYGQENGNYTIDGWHISFPLLHYVDYLFQRPKLIRWFAIFYCIFAFLWTHYCAMFDGRLGLLFSSELFF